ncbi:hypothetical protein BDB01DRAFT_442394 [Pilobolus umbonatus]|nr:hypothetical protein BDB01DRAFT_442394 [Pilobolus umbonatus]
MVTFISAYFVSSLIFLLNSLLSDSLTLSLDFNMSLSHMYLLPLDIYQEIFDYLELEYVYQCSFVCSAWYSISLKYLYRDIVLLSNTKARMFLHCIQQNAYDSNSNTHSQFNRGNLVKSLSFRMSGVESPLTSTEFNLLMSYCTLIEKLILIGNSLPYLEYLLVEKPFDMLKKLKYLEGIERHDDTEVIEAYYACCLQHRATISEIRVFDNALAYIASGYNNLHDYITSFPALNSIIVYDPAYPMLIVHDKTIEMSPLFNHNGCLVSYSGYIDNSDHTSDMNEILMSGKAILYEYTPLKYLHLRLYQFDYGYVRCIKKIFPSLDYFHITASNVMTEYSEEFKAAIVDILAAYGSLHSFCLQLNLQGSHPFRDILRDHWFTSIENTRNDYSASFHIRPIKWSPIDTSILNENMSYEEIAIQSMYKNNRKVLVSKTHYYYDDREWPNVVDEYLRHLNDYGSLLDELVIEMLCSTNKYMHFDIGVPSLLCPNLKKMYIRAPHSLIKLTKSTSSTATKEDTWISHMQLKELRIMGNTYDENLFPAISRHFPSLRNVSLEKIQGDLTIEMRNIQLDTLTLTVARRPVFCVIIYIQNILSTNDNDNIYLYEPSKCLKQGKLSSVDVCTAERILKQSTHRIFRVYFNQLRKLILHVKDGLYINTLIASIHS